MGHNNPYGKRKDKVRIMIEESMEEHNIDPESVPRGKKGYVVQYCHGNFTCKPCNGKSWMSTWSWIKFDLRNQRIKYRFHQKCASCMTPTQPYLEDDKMRKLVDKVCRKYLRRINQDDPGIEEYPLKPESQTESEIEEGPFHPQDDQTELAQMKALFIGARNSTRKHRPKLCEKCGYGHLEPCYAFILRSYRDYFINVEKMDFMDTPEE